MEPLVELGLLGILATTVAVLARWLKQPTIIGYILCGILAGPYFFNIIQSTGTIELFSHIGVAFLLFIVGIGLSPNVVKNVGRVSAITGIGQVVFTSLVGFFICIVLGFDYIESAYIAVALTFSSTIIIMKLLTDKGETETLYGRISIGFLIVQDLIAVLILISLSSFQTGFGEPTTVIGIVAKGVIMVGALLIIGVFLLPRITKAVASSQETLLLFSIGWCLALASLFQQQNFSMEIGALLAGVTLSTSEYRHEISSRMRTLRDFFIILFFILLGSQMVFSNVSDRLLGIAVLSAFILIGNPLIVLILMGTLGYTKRTSFLAGLTVAQISEFSIILVGLGVKNGHLSTEILSLVTIVGLITIAGSTYMFTYSDRIYGAISQHLSGFERKGRKVDEMKNFKQKDYDVVLFGYDRAGGDLANSFKRMGKSFLVVDYNPETIRYLMHCKVDCAYGDAGDQQFLETLPLGKAEAVVSTVRDFEANLLLIEKLKRTNANAIVFATANQLDAALELYLKGATYVIMPRFMVGEHVAKIIENNHFDPKRLAKERARQVKNLNEIIGRKQDIKPMMRLMLKESSEF